MDGGGSDAYNGFDGLDTVDFRYLAQGAIVNLASKVNGGSAAGESFYGIERIFGSSTGNDVLTAGNLAVIFSGFGGNDTLNGLAGDDALVGNDGHDALSGGIGNDRMTGGLGIDSFLFGEAGWGADRVADFQDGVDEIKVEDAIAASFAAFAVAGNGTATVTLTLTAAPANTITLQSAGGNLNITAADFVFF